MTIGKENTASGGEPPKRGWNLMKTTLKQYQALRHDGYERGPKCENPMGLQDQKTIP